MAEGSSGEKQHGNDRDADHEHGAEMRLEHQEHSEDGRHKQDRPHRDLRVLDRPTRPTQQISSEEHDCELDQLRRLHGERPHTEPTGRTVGRETDPRNEDDDEQHAAPDDRRGGEDAPPVVVHPHGAEHHDRPDRDPHQLALEQTPGALGFGDAGRRTGRQHHDGTERGENRRGAEQGKKDRGAATDRAAGTTSVRSRPGRRVPPTRRTLLDLPAARLGSGHRDASAVTARAKSSPRSP